LPVPRTSVGKRSVKIGRLQAIDRPGEGPLQGKANGDPSEVGGVEIKRGDKQPMTAGMIIARRRPIWSPTKPQNPMAKKTMALCRMLGRATSPGLSFKSFGSQDANMAIMA
jgi:hypothetical protein